LPPEKYKEGNGFVPFSFLQLLPFCFMTPDSQIEKIEKITDEVLADYPEYFRVSVRIKPTNNIKLFLDGDNGITIEKCVFFNRKIYKLVEETGMYPEGEFSLEVSSPGVDEPLKLYRQYLKNKGRNVEVLFPDGTVKEGKLLEVAEQDIILEITTGKGKKLAVQQLVIPFSNIKSTTVQVKF
jgi:ribosome maturation factor RimP